jgi:hypothetical protein
MKRLSSYFTYFNLVFSITLVVIAACCAIDTFSNKLDKGTLVKICVFSFLFAIDAIWYLIKARRVYYDDSCIYICGLLSNKLSKLEREQIKCIIKVTSIRRPLSWKLIYKDDHAVDRTAFFVKNFMNYDFDAVVQRFNG